MAPLYLRSWPSDASCSIGCISSCGEGVSVAVDWWLYEMAAGEDAAPRTGGVGPLSISSSSSSSSGCRYMWEGGTVHCMLGSQLPAERNEPHYSRVARGKHGCFQTGKHVLNIHTILPSHFDVSLVLIDRKTPSGGGRFCSGCEKTRTKE